MRFGDSCEQTAEDDAGDTTAELLGDDGADEGVEGGIAILHGEGSGLFEDSGEDGVFFEMLEGSAHNETELGRRTS